MIRENNRTRNPSANTGIARGGLALGAAAIVAFASALLPSAHW